MKTNKIFQILGYFILATMVTFASCNEEDTEVTDEEDIEITDEDDTYSYIVAPELASAELYPVHTLTTLQSGTTSISAAQEIPEIPWNIVVNGKDGFVYLNYDGILSKYSVDEDGVLVTEGSILATGVSGGPLSEFTNDSEMIVSTGVRFNDTGVFTYQVIDTEGMTEVSNGNITIELEEGEGAAPSGYIYRDGKLLVPYIHYDADGASYDFSPLQIYDAATMTLEKTITDDRSAGLGLSVVSSHGFDERGNLYIISCPSNYWGGNEDKPSGVLRINAGEEVFDEEYFLDLSSKFGGNHTAGFLYLGNDKALVQVFDGDLITEYADYQGSFVIQYHVVDLITGETEQLDIPLSLYPRNAMIISNDGKGLIATTTATESAIYAYDVASGTLTKGLVYENTDYIAGILNFK